MSIHERIIINSDQTMTTTLSSTDYFDALDRLPDRTCGETRHERLESIISMANSLTNEDRVLVICDHTQQYPPTAFTLFARPAPAPTQWYQSTMSFFCMTMNLSLKYTAPIISTSIQAPFD